MFTRLRPFIFGLDNDTAGVAERTLSQIREWPPGLPVFGQITPFPSTPLYTRLAKEGRLTRPTHWLDFAPFHMAHTPLKMTIPEVAYRSAVLHGPILTARQPRSERWPRSRMSRCLTRSVTWWRDFVSAAFTSRKRRAGWVKVLLENRNAIFGIVRESFTKWRGSAPDGVGWSSMRAWDAKRFRRRAPQQKTGTVGLPLADPIAVFLASADSGWLTGETLLASGGLRKCVGAASGSPHCPQFLLRPPVAGIASRPTPASNLQPDSIGRRSAPLRERFAHDLPKIAFRFSSSTFTHASAPFLREVNAAEHKVAPPGD